MMADVRGMASRRDGATKRAELAIDWLMRIGGVAVVEA